jgi:hypothetical protein
MTTRWRVFTVSMSVAATLASARPAHAATISWKGHTWNVTSGGMAGVCRGTPANVFVDASGYLHLRITNDGGTWTAAEIFSTDKLGFGTYQWQIEGSTDKLDKNVVVGLFPYGPEGGLGSSGNNEIDIEIARWGNDAWPNGNYTICPPTGSKTESHTFTFSLAGGTALTTRFSWSSSKIDFATLAGFVAIDAENGLIDSWTFAPANPTASITQEAMPLGMNLWCFESPPSDGKEVEIIVRDLQVVPLGMTVDGGAGGGGGAGGASGGAGGARGRDAPASTDAAAGRGGAAATGGEATGSAAATGGSAGIAGAVGTGGAGRGGAASDGGIGGGGVAGGAAGSAGTSDRADAADGAGAASTGGAAGSGGAAGAGGAASAGCGCGVASPRTRLGGRIILLAVALLLAGRHRRRRQT